ncbi:unnamed protein product [Psylliodes chrysocephalus]|uniref:Uncharacterized protein n=1 Tax=Psylliodes chrysocephalus TaxID=3402493 RepID=A0A9P0CX56_9CUCU|nr:unnamed protein product [Psylliodes chrysocephala]
MAEKKKIEIVIPETKRQGLKNLCTSRWVERHDYVLVMKELYKSVCLALEEIKNWTDRSTSSEKRDLDLCTALELAARVTEQVKDIRVDADNQFKGILREADDVLKQYDIDI